MSTMFKKKFLGVLVVTLAVLLACREEKAGTVLARSEQQTSQTDPFLKELPGKIVFQSDRDGDWEIYVMNADGTNPSRLTNNPAGDYRPAWSPDGRYITFHSNRDDGTEIYVMNADGKNPIRLTNNSASDYRPAWTTP